MAATRDQIEDVSREPVGAAEAVPRGVGRKRAIVLAGLQILLIWLVASVVVWQNHRNAVGDWKRTAENTSLTVAAYIAQTLGAADLVLKSIQDWIGEEDIVSEAQFRSVMQERRFFDAMRDRVVGLPQVGVAGIIASNGELLNNIHAHPSPPVDLSDRESYRTAMALGASALVLTAPLRGRTSGRWTFYLSRKVTAKSGEALGVITVGLDVDFFTKFFREISYGGGSGLALFRSDGTLLATTVVGDDLLGRRFENTLSRRLMLDGGSGKAVLANVPNWFRSDSPRDRIVVPRQIEGYPVFLSLAIAESTFLKRWYETSSVVILVALLLTGATFFAAHRILRLIDQSAAASRAESERHLLAAVVDTPSALTAVLDRDGHILHANARFREVFGLEADMHATLQNPDLRGAESVRAFVAGDARIGEVDLELERSGHQTRMLHFSLARRSLPDSGECTIMLGHDETVRHQARQAIALSAKMVTLGEVTTGIAHELSQPLNVIRMAAQNALTEIEPDKGGPEDEPPPAPLSDVELRRFVAGKLHRVVAQVDRAGSILARMRLFSRETRQGPQPFDIRDACRGALALVKSKLRGAGVAVREVLGDEPLIVMGHPTQIEQGILNLLLNAVDALQDSPPTDKAASLIQIAAGRGGDGHVWVRVTDNGPGVPEAIRERIFEPFFTTKPVGQGTGLGLASTFSLVRDAGGTLTLVGDGPGATFQIDLPAAAPEATAAST